MAKTNSALVTDLYQTFLQRQPTASELTYYTDRLDWGLITRAGIAHSIMNSKEYNTAAEEVARLYLAAFNRIPDTDGLSFWLTIHRNGATNSQIADIFARSPEFEAKYGPNVSNTAFIDLLYNNVLGRGAESNGKQYWKGVLDYGMTRGDVVNYFAQSTEHQTKTASKVITTLLYATVAGRVPTDAELAAAPTDREQLVVKAADAAGVAASSASIAYSASAFSENQNNDGTIGNTITLTLKGDTFKGANGAALGKITNTPSGLTASLTKTDDTTASLTLKGTAKDHAATNSIENLTITLDNNAFTSGKASNVAGATKTDIKVSFLDLPIKELSGTLSATGVLATTLTVDLATDKLIYGSSAATLLSGSMASVNSVDFSGLKPSTSTSSTGGKTTATASVSIKGDDLDNTIVSSGYATTIDGGKGDDTITAGSAKDTIVFASTATNNGKDIISGFTIGTGGDVLNFSAFLNKTGVSNVVALNLGTDPIRTWNNGDVVIIQGNGLDATTLAASLNDATLFAAPRTGKAVFITTDIIGDASIWYLVNQTGTTTITASEITLVGTLKDVNNLTLAGFTSANFA